MSELKKIKSEIIEYGKLAGIKNFTPGYSGNFSGRFEDKILITSSGSSNGYLSEDEFKDILVETPIPGSVAMKDTSLNHEPIVTLQPQHQAAIAIRKVIKELISREVF